MWSPRFHSNFRILRQEKVFSHLTLYTNDAGQSNYSWKTPNSVAREVQGCRWPKIQRNFPRMLDFWHTNIPLLNKRESLLHESGSFRVWGLYLRVNTTGKGRSSRDSDQSCARICDMHVTCVILGTCRPSLLQFSVWFYVVYWLHSRSSRHFLTDRWLQVEKYYAV